MLPMLAPLPFLTKKHLRHRHRLGTALRRLVLEPLEQRCVLATAYLATDLVSDQPGVAPLTDSNLINGWGIAVNPTGAFWVSSNGEDISTLYTGDVAGTPLMKNSLEVTIPGGEPTGQVFNSTPDFTVPGQPSKSVFIFATQAGIIAGWRPGTTTADVGADNSATGDIYTGIALGNNGMANFLYAADFHNAEIDVFN